MFCEKCGHPLPENALFCEECGAKVEGAEVVGGTAGEKAAKQPAGAARENGKNQVAPVPVGGSGDIRLCADGKYRWYYEYPMLKKPSVLFTLWKILLLAALAPALITFLAELSEGFFRALGQFLSVYGLVFGIAFVLSCVGYFILAAIYGFSYIVLFEMDEEGVTHAQQDKQYKKAQAVSWLTVLAGAAKGNPGVVGTGLLAGSRQKMTSVFGNVQTVIGQRRWNTIKVNQLLAKNQVYVKDEDYDFVWNYITSRCKKAKIK